MPTDRAIEMVAKLQQYRRDIGRDGHEFTVLAPLTDVLGPHTGGITQLLPSRGPTTASPMHTSKPRSMH